MQNENGTGEMELMYIVMKKEGMKERTKRKKKEKKSKNSTK